MQSLPPALKPFEVVEQFIIYKIVQRSTGKTDKIPINYKTLEIMPANVNWQNDPKYYTSAKNIFKKLSQLGNDHGIGFLFTDKDNFWCIDIDNCLVNEVWSPIAITLCNLLPNAAVEISYSGKGLHIFGTGTVPVHKCKSNEFKIELYNEKRFIALTGTQARGLASTNYSDILPSIVNKYFKPTELLTVNSWTTKSRDEWTNPGTDEQLIKKACESSSIAGKFGNKASFKNLWDVETDVLAEMFPPTNDVDVCDWSNVDAALALHLAFWTGCNCDHIWRLMWLSQLQRDKWRWHKTYLQITITKAVSLCKLVYTQGSKLVNQNSQFDVPSLKGTPQQIKWANEIREEKLLMCVGDKDLIKSLSINHGPALESSFWINRRDEIPLQLVKSLQPSAKLVTIETIDDKPILKEGFQYMSSDKQIEHFTGCFYVQDVHKIFTPTGALLRTEQFNSTYGGYVFQLDNENNGKTTKKAYEVFTESQAVAYPMAETQLFRPDLPAGKLFRDNKTVCVNSYIKIDTPMIEGDINLFFFHMEKLLPIKTDRDIIIAYMAACVQNKGHKFQWTPIMQGVQGNGKTLLTRCVAFAIGNKYTHLPFANEITEKYNDWLFTNIFIGVEDIVVTDQRQEIFEILKPMITNDRLAVRSMGISQDTKSCCANFLLNMNPKTGFRIEDNERRYAPFFTAQQKKSDLKRDGMTGTYFSKLYTWLRCEGYQKVNYFLNNYKIPIELNPAITNGGLCGVAPVTSSTKDAIYQSMGGVEQEIIESIEQNKIGFGNGWISATWLNTLLNNLGVARRIPHNRRVEILSNMGYVPHPSLSNGRANHTILIDGARSKLFIKSDHMARLINNPTDVIKAYESAQSTIVDIFKNKS